MLLSSLELLNLFLSSVRVGGIDYANIPENVTFLSDKR